MNLTPFDPVTDLTGGAIALASPVDGTVLEGGFAVSFATNVMQTVNGVRGVLSSLDGRERPSTFAQLGGMGGEQGAAVGELLSMGLTAQGAAKALSNPVESMENLVEIVRPFYEVFPFESEAPLDNKSRQERLATSGDL